MLQLKNATPFAAKLMLLPDADGVDTLFTVVKGTFTLGARPVVAEEQAPVALMDEHYADPATSSIRLPSDVCLDKAATDVLLIGSAWASQGTPTWQMEVSLSIGPLTKSVRVFGDRVWAGNVTGVSMAWVAPFVRMPLVWERAFGGADATAKGPTAEPRNPVGAGFHPAGGMKPLAGAPLPNVDDPAALIASPKDAPAPAGFAPIAPHWEPRKSFAGTYDEAWQARRAPYLPTDFDTRFFQLAPPGLAVPGHLRGGKLVEVRGATESGALRVALPEIEIRVTHRVEGRDEDRTPALDAVILEPDAGRLMMVWRTALRCDKKALKIDEVNVRLQAGRRATA